MGEIKETLSKEALDRLTCTDAQLKQLHKAELASVVRDPKALALVQEDHRKQWEARVNARKSAENKAVRAEKAEANKAVRKAAKEAKSAAKPTPIAQAPKVNLCKACGKPIAPTGKRGRPAAYHEEHRPQKAA